jgi:glycosyltransferase involved in cell wall biosynthesis
LNLKLNLSVIITCFNYEQYVGAAIESALKCKSVAEVIVVDDGSSDRSMEVIRKYEPRVVVIEKENGGQASAFNAGFQAISESAEWVVFLDADDVLIPESFDQIRLADRYSKYHARLFRMNMTGCVSGMEPSMRYRLSEGDCSRAVFTGQYVTVPTSGNVCSVSFLKKVLPMPEEPFRISADNYLNLLAPFYGSIGVIAKPFSYYRVHGANNYAGRSGVSNVNEYYAKRMRILEARANILLPYKEHLFSGLSEAHVWTFSGMAIVWLHRHVASEVNIDLPIFEVKARDLMVQCAWQFQLNWRLGALRFSQTLALFVAAMFLRWKGPVANTIVNDVLRRIYI